MPNFAQAIKAEIVRLSRKEIRASVNPVRASNITLKNDVRELKKIVLSLETENKRLSAFCEDMREKQPAVSPEAAEKARFTSKGIRILRKKLGLSQNSFAKLLGVSSQAVYAMEHKERRLKFRSATLSTLLCVREMGKRDARKKLEAIEAKK